MTIGSFLRPLRTASVGKPSPKASIRIVLASLAGMSLAVSAAENQAGAERSRHELQRLPLTEFYQTPRALPPGKPGELIRAMPFEEYYLPPDVAAVRFLYHSRSSAGSDVAASGVVLFPDREPPAEGWPVIAWAHEFAGVARQCAPSLLINPQHGPFLTMYVGLGYAVIVPDYTGLGTDIPNAAADIPSNAADVIYSVPAARRAVRGLGSRWISMGTEEGALASIGVAEIEGTINDPSYLGAIALSGLTEFDDTEAMSRSAYSWPLVLAYTIKRIYPEFHESDILTGEALSAYAGIGARCSGAEANRSTAGRMLKPNWRTNGFVASFLERNRLGLRAAARPLLVVSSREDPALGSTRRVMRRLCRQQDRVEFALYPDSDPGRVIGDSVRDQIAWMEARRSGRSAPTNCSAQP